MVEVPNRLLHPKDIPSQRATWLQIEKFAFTFDGYRYLPNRACANLANRALRSFAAGSIDLGNMSLSKLRSCLFFEQRRYHHFGWPPEATDMKYIRTLVAAIRSKVAASEAKGNSKP